MRDAHNTHVHRKHVTRKGGEAKSMRGERRHHDLIDQYLISLLLAAQEQNCFSGIRVEGVAQYAVNDALLKPDDRQC